MRHDLTIITLFGTMVTLAAPSFAATITVNANAGRYVALPSNQTVYTDQRSISNRYAVPGGFQGDLTRITNGVTTYSTPGSTATRFSVSASEPQSTASAYGDLRTGKVGAFAGTTPSGYAAASASISDTLSFTIPGANASTITPLRYLVSLHATSADAETVFAFGGGGNYTMFGRLNQPYYINPIGWASASSWMDGTTRYFDLTYNLVGADPTVGIGMTLEALAGLGSVTDFSNTAGISIIAPAGVTFTSQSGVFLSGAVPEPSSWTMLIAGFGVVGAMVRRRRRMAASA